MLRHKAYPWRRRQARETRIEASDAVWFGLARADAHPADPSAARGVEWIQTHLSHVYRTAVRVYKFRKPVSFGFVDFATRAERNADCLREVALNRRLAPDVYLGVAALRGDASHPRIGEVGEQLAEGGAPEHCVVMRRLADGRDALSLLEAGALSAAHLDVLAERVAHFHEGCSLGAPAPFSAEEWRDACVGPVEDNFAALAGEGPLAALLAPLRARARAFAELHGARFESRRAAGRAVDGHGDLHLQHVWFETADAAPIVIDCLEFNAGLRRIDQAAEVAFPAMDLRYRGRADLAERFLRRYARERDDFDLYAVVDYFVSYRAAVRAKVAALAARDGQVAPRQRAGADASARRHLALAGEVLAAREGAPALVVMAGVVGTGKSTAAEALADAVGGVVVASDRVRKRLLGVAETERVGAGWGGGGYTAEWTRRTYAGLLDRAQPVLRSGRCAILDATFASRARREEVLRAARDLGVPALAVEVVCAPDVARARLARRAASQSGPSDAGPAEYEASARAFEPLDEWAEAARVRIDTGRDGWRDALRELAARIAAPG